MGGSAFASRGLATPRMPATIYQQVLSRTHRILKGCYRDVGTPSKLILAWCLGQVRASTCLEGFLIFAGSKRASNPTVELKLLIMILFS